MRYQSRADHAVVTRQAVPLAVAETQVVGGN